MFTSEDLALIHSKGISLEKMEEYLESFKNGYPPLWIKDVASVKNGGILELSDKEKHDCGNEWKSYLKTGHRIVKFVPASGAASRMFKDLFEFLNGESDIPTKTEVLMFFNHIERFAFFEDLNEACFRNDNHSVMELMEKKEYKAVVRNLLEKQGLNYGFLPKGLIKFHSYPAEKRTPVHEHLLEGVLYAGDAENSVNIHFTVSGEHNRLFRYLMETEVPKYEQRYGITCDITFSEQKPSTDTLAVDMENNPFRENNELLFRPGGHGALIENLNDIDADIIFIKNIDNVVPDRLKAPTVDYKKIIAGLLVQAQNSIFGYLHLLDDDGVSDAQLDEIHTFCEKKLNVHAEEWDVWTRCQKVEFLRRKLNRPIRVCGMVRNLGEPGGGPFLVYNQDGTYSTQILESSQINMDDAEQKEVALSATHFNPVDLVCAVRGYKGFKFDLLNYVDRQTGFISRKSKNGRELKALELPGLWNGAMSDWNTIFVEVPVETFNPVKAVNDLLREQHQ